MSVADLVSNCRQVIHDGLAVAEYGLENHFRMLAWTEIQVVGAECPQFSGVSIVRLGRAQLVDATTLPQFLARIWVIDRGIPTEAHLELILARSPQYLVGTPKGRLYKLEATLAARAWLAARAEVRVKLFPEDGDLYVYVESQVRIGLGTASCDETSAILPLQQRKPHIGYDRHPARPGP